MPSNLQNSNGVSWGESKMNNLTAASQVGGALMDIDLFNLAGTDDGSLADVKGKLDQIGGFEFRKIIELGKTQYLQKQ